MSNYEIDFWWWIHILHFKYVWNLPTLSLAWFFFFHIEFRTMCIVMRYPVECRAIDLALAFFGKTYISSIDPLGITELMLLWRLKFEMQKRRVLLPLFLFSSIKKIPHRGNKKTKNEELNLKCQNLQFASNKR